MPITRNFTLYLNAGISVAPTVHVNQYDRGEQWVFTLLDDKGQKYTPSSGALIGVKADGNAIAGVTGTVGSNGDVYITETQQMTAAAGKAIFELTIDGMTHGTANFIVQVEKKPTEDAVLSESDLSIIQQGIDSVTPAAINETVSEYLAEHMTNPPIDPTLTVSNAAADAKVTGDKVTELKTALNNAYNEINQHVSYDELYNGYQNKVPTYEHGYINSSGVYTSQTDQYISSNVYETAKNTKLVNNSSDSVQVLYFSSFTSYSNFTFGTYATVTAGNELTLAAQYPYCAVQGVATTTEPEKLRGVYFVGNSELEYLSYNNLHDVPEIKEDVNNLKNGLVEVEPTEIQDGKYMNMPVGSSATIYSSSAFALGIFTVKPNTKYIAQTQGRTSTSKYFEFADINNIVLQVIEVTPQTTGDVITAEMISPAGAAKLYINATNGTQGTPAIQYINLKESTISEASEELASNEQMRFVAAAQKTFTNTPADNYAENRLPTFVHVADDHGDAERFGNAVKIAELINADAILNTGDNVAYYPTDSVSFLAEKMADASFPMLPLIGNHESYTYTEQEMYEKFIQPFADGLTLDSAVTYPTYYYRDFSSKNLRVIGINQFQYRGVSNMTTERNYHQAQIDFLCNALINAPDGYGVIVMLHTPEASTAKSTGFTKFYQDEILYNNTGASIKPIYEIIDAYISGTAINKTFNNISGNTPATFTANADFSAKHNSEFICYVSGHMHRDAVYYLTDVTNKQLMLNVVCTNAWSHRNINGTAGSNYPYYCELTDLPRVIGTETENAVNVYTIDRVNKTVRIVRVGSDTPYNFDERRDYMVIPYAD